MRILPNEDGDQGSASSPLPHLHDQVQDFLWVSLVQSFLVLLGAMDGFPFVADEILLLVVLVVIKHNVRPILSRFTESS